MIHFDQVLFDLTTNENDSLLTARLFHYLYNIYLAYVLIIVYVFLGEPLQKLEFFMMSFHLMFNTAICVTCPIIACDKQYVLKILSATQSTNVIHQIHHTVLLFHMPRPSKVLWCMQ